MASYSLLSSTQLKKTICDISLFFQYKYYFTDLRSLDPDITFDPLLSIPLKGYVPHTKTGIRDPILRTSLCYLMCSFSAGHSLHGEVDRHRLHVYLPRHPQDQRSQSARTASEHSSPKTVHRFWSVHSASPSV
jgi:hypothetical protein